MDREEGGRLSYAGLDAGSGADLFPCAAPGSGCRAASENINGKRFGERGIRPKMGWKLKVSRGAERKASGIEFWRTYFF